MAQLGPDIIRDEFDMDEAVRRVRSNEDRDIATALLDQRAISGIGNVFKVEALFLARISPWARVRDLDDAKLRAVIEHARKLIRLNRDGGERRTHFGLNARERMWVDERSGLPWLASKRARSTSVFTPFACRSFSSAPTRARSRCAAARRPAANSLSPSDTTYCGSGSRVTASR